MEKKFTYNGKEYILTYTLDIIRAMETNGVPINCAFSSSGQPLYRNTPTFEGVKENVTSFFPSSFVYVKDLYSPVQTSLNCFSKSLSTLNNTL